MINNDSEDEIIIGINRPQVEKSNKKKKVAKKATYQNKKGADKTNKNKKIAKRF